MTDAEQLRPLQPVRRFDVFAETKRLAALAHGGPEDVAKGYGIRIAKIVASRRFGGAAKQAHGEKAKPVAEQAEAGSRFGGEGAASFAPSTTSCKPTRPSTTK